MCMTHGYFQAIISPASACSMSNLHTHCPITSSISCSNIDLRVFHVLGKGLNYLSLQWSTTGQGLDLSQVGPR